jgi:DNA-binding response OmpR family regulator
MRQRLEAEGYVVSEASTCAAAIALAAGADVVLLNRVQDLDESTAVRRLRESVPGTPVILTAPARPGPVAALEGA